MLVIMVPGVEQFNEATDEFVAGDAVRLEMEHSLVSLSKWESLHEKPFLGNDQKTTEDVVSYVKMMIIGPEPAPDVLARLTDENYRAINQYINAKMSATWFNDSKTSRGAREVVTAEIIYYWMITLNIPFECQYWHLNRLLTLVKVCNMKNAPKKRMTGQERAAQQRSLNAQRKQQLGTSG